MGKRKHTEKSEGEFDLGFKHLKAIHSITNEKKLIVVLSGAQLETIKVNFELLRKVPLLLNETQLINI
jgi:hypothetical protein